MKSVYVLKISKPARVKKLLNIIAAAETNFDYITIMCVQIIGNSGNRTEIRLSFH